MEHPLRSEKNKSLRRDFLSLIKNGHSIQRTSNIVFVCGGNNSKHMRRQFQGIFDEILPEFEFFEPEFAIDTYLELDDKIPFEITEFEALIGKLSHSIVLFPEAAGSYAETGYFALVAHLAEITLVALDSKFQKEDSFISLGPAKLIQDKSKFGSTIQLDYKSPDFNIIAERLKNRRPLNKNRRTLELSTFPKLDPYELFALIQTIVSILVIATIDDIISVLRGVFDGNVNTSQIKKITSILVGANFLNKTGDFGHLKANGDKGSILILKDGLKPKFDELTVGVSATFFDADPDFKSVLGM